MNEATFVERREPDWQRLTRLCDMADRSVSSLNASELHEFVRLYRRASGDLATARTLSTNAQLIDFLNDLVARAYGILYRSPRPGCLASIANSIQVAVDTVRRRRWFVASSLAIFLAGGLFSFFIMKAVPSTRGIFVPKQFENAFDHWKTGSFEERNADEAFGMTGFYASNNPRVAVFTGAAAAATFGLGSFYFVWQNGAIMGVLLHEVQPYGRIGYVVGSILPHGVPEISGLILSGAAGFVMGAALIAPGRRRRGDALRAAGKDAIVLLATGVALMFVAAPIEGFFSFSPSVPLPVKIAVGVVELVIWLTFWTYYGRGDAEPSASAS